MPFEKQSISIMKNKLKSFLLTAFCSLGLASVFAQAPTVHTIGDSTMEEKSTDPSVNTNGQRGWPQMLPQFMVNGATLNNRAKSGTSSKTFYEESRFWTTVKPQIKEGDYVIIQFGHNDSKTDEDRYTDPRGDRFTDGSYKKSMMDYINIAKEKGAKPILATSISRRNLKDDTLELYVNAAKELGNELHIPVLDLYGKTKEYINEVGVEEAKSMFNHVKIKDSRFINDTAFINSGYYLKGDTDDTHINLYGADLISQYATEEMQRLALPLADKINNHKAVYPLPSYTEAVTVE